MRRGCRELRVAGNRASIGALDQKLSRPEVGVERKRIDSESILAPTLLNSLSFFLVVKKENVLKMAIDELGDARGIYHAGRWSQTPRRWALLMALLRLGSRDA
ncbi:hypothetical protein PIB30_017646 [Stylosanthes scabra]|uniref:Uncharacterized protein n=1 Tax=Stylosanthes scabra TaxID=79078 RepID=A0ABU6X7W5_9FABA|nr:hypothetical protein [Stylosanthes scabra]